MKQLHHLSKEFESRLRLQHKNREKFSKAFNNLIMEQIDIRPNPHLWS